MAHHDQRGKDAKFVCTDCRGNLCANCLDVLRFSYTSIPICHCGRAEHQANVDLAVLVNKESWHST